MFISRPPVLPVMRPNGCAKLSGDTGLPMLRLGSQMQYLHTDGEVITVGTGFVFDGGSVPSLVRWFLHPHCERAMHPFALHDHLTRDTHAERHDRILFYALRERGVSLPVAFAAYCATRLWCLLRRQAEKPAQDTGTSLR